MKLKIPITSIENGMITASDIVNPGPRKLIIIPAGTTLKRKHKEILINLGIYDIFIVGKKKLKPLEDELKLLDLRFIHAQSPESLWIKSIVKAHIESLYDD